MVSRMETSMARLHTRLTSRSSVVVSITRGQQTTTGVTAMPDSQLLRVTDPNTGDVTTVRTNKDFKIARADYQIAGVAVEPIRGDKITEVIDGVTAVYEVLPYGDEPLYRWCDEYRQVYRIHTKRVA